MREENESNGVGVIEIEKKGVTGKDSRKGGSDREIGVIDRDR